MDRAVQVRVIGSNPEGAGPGPGWVPARSTWATRVALLTFLVIVGLPLLILVGVAVAAAAVVFTGLALLTAAARRIKGAWPGQDGRSNVRTIRRD